MKVGDITVAWLVCVVILGMVKLTIPCRPERFQLIYHLECYRTLPTPPPASHHFKIGIVIVLQNVCLDRAGKANL